MALALGRTVNELLDSLTGAEYQDWIAYYNEEPFGFEREDYHTALISSTVANMAGKTLKKEATILDYMHSRGRVASEEAFNDEVLYGKLDFILGGRNVKK